MTTFDIFLDNNDIRKSDVVKASGISHSSLTTAFERDLNSCRVVFIKALAETVGKSVVETFAELIAIETELNDK